MQDSELVTRIFASIMALYCFGVFFCAYKFKKVPYGRSLRTGMSYVELNKSPKVYWIIVAYHGCLLLGSIFVMILGHF
jgi:hypothetical protein